MLPIVSYKHIPISLAKTALFTVLAMYRLKPVYISILYYRSGLNITPETYSTGIEHGNASLITFSRIPNAIKYFISSGDVNVTMDHFAVDSTDIFWVSMFSP